MQCDAVQNAEKCLQVVRKELSEENSAFVVLLEELAAQTRTIMKESLCMFPKDEQQRKKWVKFVRKRRTEFTPTTSSTICSAHF